MVVIAGTVYPRIQVAAGQLDLAALNVATPSAHYGTIIVPGDKVVARKATVTCASVQNADYVTIDGITFTAATTEVLATHVFTSGGGNGPVAVSLAACINSAAYGVPGVTAVVSATNLVTLTPSQGHPKLISITSSDSTRLACVTPKGNPNVQTVGNTQLTVVDMWGRAIGDGTSSAMTAIELHTTASTPVVIASFAKAQLGDGLIVRASATGCGTVTNFMLPNAPGEGLKICATVADATVMSAFDYCIYYVRGIGNTRL